VIQAKAADISERVRRQVEQRLSVARRQVEAAQRRVEREVERGTRGPGSGRLSIDVKFGGPKAAPREAISEEERIAVLKMLEEGKISVEDAQRLLAALEGSGE
jgi:L-aminopeptidase/D-esterase-like protein